MDLIDNLIKNAPKAELHVHLEGTLEPEMAIQLAHRNGILLRFSDAQQIRKQFVFTSLQDFLDLYNELICVLVTEEDFYDLTCAYFERMKGEAVRHVELFFDPQGHVRRGVAFEVVLRGIVRGLHYGHNRGITSHLIMCLLRDADDGMQALERAIQCRKHISGVGLASAEKNHPPEAFVTIFKKAREHGFFAVAHAGEEGPSDYIWQALDYLNVLRIDHGNACTSDPLLIERLAREQIALTMCPLSNLHLKIVSSLEQHPAKFLLDRGICVTINSDDPAYFGGYINQNLIALARALSLTKNDIYTLLKNSFRASCIPELLKTKYINELDNYWRESH